MTNFVESDLKEAMAVPFDDVTDAGIVLSSLTKHELELGLFSLVLQRRRGNHVLACSVMTNPLA